MPIGLLLGGCALAALATAPVHAQTAAPSAGSSTTAPAPSASADQPQNGDIIVTAQRRDESLSRVGISVTALGAGDLVRNEIRKPQDLAGLVPGFQSTSTYGGATTYFIRGVGFNNINVSSTSPVGIYIDQASVPYSYMANDISFDLERVEILKGPQGTLYGRNTTGGLVNYVAAKPTPDFHWGATLEGGSYGTLNASAYASGPLSDLVRVRVAADIQNQGDWQYSVTRHDHLGELHSYAGRAIVDIGNGGPFKATITAMAWTRNGDTQAPQAIAYLFASSPFANPLTAASILTHPTNDREADWALASLKQPYHGLAYPGPTSHATFASGTLNMSYKLAPTLTIASLSTYDNLVRNDVEDLSGVQTNAGSIGNSGTIKSFSQELRLIGESDRFNWSIGGYFAQDHTFEQQLNYLDDSTEIVDLRELTDTLPHPNFSSAQILGSFANGRSAGEVHSNIYAGFANAEYKFSSLFKLTAGGRFTEDRARYVGGGFEVNGNAIPLVDTFYPLITGGPVDLQPNGSTTLNAANTGFVPGVSSHQNQSNFAFNVRATLTPTPTTLFYGSISRGFKAGSFPVLSASHPVQLDPATQEELTAYEVGTKLGLFDRRVQFDASAFYYDYKNKQVYGRIADIIFGSLARILNIPKSRIYGVEGDVRIKVAPSVTAIAAGSYLNSKVTSNDPDFNDLGVPVNQKGRPFAYTPEFSGSGTLLYDQAISDNLRLNASATVTYQTSSHGDLAGLSLFDIKPYALVNGTLGIENKSGLSLTAYGKNLFNTYYYTGVVSGVDTVFRYAGRPRELGIRLNYKY